MPQEIITRKEAREKGLRYYYSGIPCVHGHLSNRRTSSGYCLTCNLLAVRQYQKDHPSAVSYNSMKWNEKNKERCKVYKARYRAKLRAERYAAEAAAEINK